MRKSNLQSLDGATGAGLAALGDAGPVPRDGAGLQALDAAGPVPLDGVGLGPESAAAPRDGAGLHVAIIMDGNGRWAIARGLPRVAGHRHGALAVRRAVEAAPALGISTLTLYAFSSDNWRRPPEEVSALMQLLLDYLRKETAACIEKGVHVSVLGRRDRLSQPLREGIETAEAATARGKRMHLRIAVDYSARDSILRAASRVSTSEVTREVFSRLLAEAGHATPPAPDVDLLIRTGGEKRLSDFLLWEAAYAELHFTHRLWPEFQAADLEAAVRDFHGRQRRFGALPEAAVQ
jgi:undecaprenyl diphosphate synthase